MLRVERRQQRHRHAADAGIELGDVDERDAIAIVGEARPTR
jgi:hypothetical protein